MKIPLLTHQKLVTNDSAPISALVLEEDKNGGNEIKVLKTHMWYPFTVFNVKDIGWDERKVSIKITYQVFRTVSDFYCLRSENLKSWSNGHVIFPHLRLGSYV